MTEVPPSIYVSRAEYLSEEAHIYELDAHLGNLQARWDAWVARHPERIIVRRAEYYRERRELRTLRGRLKPEWSLAMHYLATYRWTRVRELRAVRRLIPPFSWSILELYRESRRRITRLQRTIKAEQARLERKLIIPPYYIRLLREIGRVEAELNRERERFERKIISVEITKEVVSEDEVYRLKTGDDFTVKLEQEGETVEEYRFKTGELLTRTWILPVGETYTITGEGTLSNTDYDFEEEVTAVEPKTVTNEFVPENKLIALHKRWQYKSPRGKYHDISIESVATVIVPATEKKEDWETRLREAMEAHLYETEGFERLTMLRQEVLGFQEKPTDKPVRDITVEEFSWWHRVMEAKQLDLTPYLEMA